VPGWGARPLAATITVAIIGAAPVVLRFHCEADVFAMKGLTAARPHGLLAVFPRACPYVRSDI
jgi:hypothetical protein